MAISASGRPAVPASVGDRVALSLGEPLERKLPRIGLGVATHEAELSEGDKELLGAIHLDHLRADVHLSNSDAIERLARAEQECAALGCASELALFLTDNAEQEVAGFQTRVPLTVPVSRVLVFHENEQVTSGRWVEQARRTIGPSLPGVPFCGGTNLYFAD